MEFQRAASKVVVDGNVVVGIRSPNQGSPWIRDRHHLHLHQSLHDPHHPPDVQRLLGLLLLGHMVPTQGAYAGLRPTYHHRPCIFTGYDGTHADLPKCGEQLYDGRFANFRTRRMDLGTGL